LSIQKLTVVTENIKQKAEESGLDFERRATGEKTQSQGEGLLIDFVTPNYVPKLFICAQADASVLQNRRLSVFAADEQKIISLALRPPPSARMHK